MKLFRKDRDKERVIDIDEFDELEEEDAKSKELTIEEYEKAFIYHIENGCPICRGDVKGNDYFKYFCKGCNILFDKHKIMEKDFGKGADSKVRLKVVPLTEEQKKTLQDRKKAMIERVQQAFGERTGTDEGKEDALEQAGQDVQEEDSGEPVEELLEESAEEADEEYGLLADDDKSQEADNEGLPDAKDNMPLSGIESALRMSSLPKTQPSQKLQEQEYDIEEEGKIIASAGSTKMHKGNCHFVRKINPENRKYFRSIEEAEAEGYVMCVCLRRLVAQKRAEEKDNAEEE